MDDLKGWATLVGALVAGLTGIFNLIVQIRGKTDRFYVSPTSFYDYQVEDVFIHVVNLSDHPIKLADWGWVDHDKRLRSIPSELSEPDFIDSHHFENGTPSLEKRNDLFEIGYIRRDRPIGAYARSATQKRPTITFRYDTSVLLKLKVRLRVWWLGVAYLH
jgi:hypothetical protein